MLYDTNAPIGEGFYVHHMPDKNNHRQPDKVMATMDIHKRRMGVLLVPVRYRASSCVTLNDHSLGEFKTLSNL